MDYSMRQPLRPSMRSSMFPRGSGRPLDSYKWINRSSGQQAVLTKGTHGGQQLYVYAVVDIPTDTSYKLISRQTATSSGYMGFCQNATNLPHNGFGTVTYYKNGAAWAVPQRKVVLAELTGAGKVLIFIKSTNWYNTPNDVVVSPTGSAAGVSGTIHAAGSILVSDVDDIDVLQTELMAEYGVTPPILDVYPGAAVAVSLRLLNSDYTGDAILVRESGSDIELAIGFTQAGILDEAALLAHCGANDGFVSAWYDQSGDARTVQQGSHLDQPKIVTAGVMETKNGKAAVLFDGLSNNFDTSLSASTYRYGHVSSAWVCGDIPTNGNYKSVWQWGTGSGTNKWVGPTYQNGDAKYYDKNLSAASIRFTMAVDLDHHQFSFHVGDADKGSAFESGGTSTLDFVRPDMHSYVVVFTIGSRDGGGKNHFFSGAIQEIILWKTDQLENQAEIDADQISYYL